MFKRSPILLAALLLVAGLAACSDDQPASQPDAGDVAADGADALPDSDEDPDGGEPGEFPIDDPGPITDLRIDGLENPVEIKIDEHGIPSIRCQSDQDCVAALGYMHARDRFIQMDLRRRVVRGRLSEIVAAGDIIVDVDAANRTLFSTRDGVPLEEAILEHASPRTMGLLEAYSDGVNAWIDDLVGGRNGASLALEYGFNLIELSEIAPWTPEDCFAAVAAIINNLTNDASGELALGEVLAAIEASSTYDQSVFDDYFRPRPFSDSTILDDYTYPSAKAGTAAPGDRLRLAGHAAVLRQARLALERLNALLGAAADRGSNNWVVGPDRTASGNALLSNDPHLGLANPAVWYIAHMDATANGGDGAHVAGLTFPGIPWVVIGHNEDIAWGATNTSFDLSDVYLEQLTEDGTGVLFDGNEVPFVEVDFDFPQPDGSVATRRARYVPHHGPVLSIDEEDGTAVSLRWTGHSISTDVNFLTEVARASSVEEGREAARNVTSIGQNWVFIDTAGNFGWFPYNTVPIRPWATTDLLSAVPLDGTGGQEWDGFVDYDDLPQAYNLDQGYVATANNDMTGAVLDGDPTNDGHPLLQSFVATGFRHQRIADLLEASDQHTTESMRRIVGDTFSIAGQLLSPAFLAVDRTGLTANAQALYDAIDGWEYTCPTGLATADQDGEASPDAGERSEALGCAAFHRVLSDSRRGWSADEVDANEWALWPTLDSFFRALARPQELTDPDLFWDDVSTSDVTETQADILASAFESGAAWFEEEVGNDPLDWLWGRVHGTRLAADLFSDFGVADYDEGRYAKDGGLYTVNVANPSIGGASLNHGSGASMRLICEAPSSGVTCGVELPGGEPHFRGDPNYLGLLDEWLDNQPVDLVFDHDALDATPIVGNPPE